jgi:hypothetical protein
VRLLALRRQADADDQVAALAARAAAHAALSYSHAAAGCWTRYGTRTQKPKSTSS